VRLCELVQHLFMFDFVAVSRSMHHRVVRPEILPAHRFLDSAAWACEPQRSAA
jgi:hypothetical protein